MRRCRNQTRTTSSKWSRTDSFPASWMGTDQRDERWRVEETCLIKMKWWRGGRGIEGCSLMRALDAPYTLFSYITHDFCLRGSSWGWDGRRCCRRRERGKEGASLMKFLIIQPPLAQGRITECHLGQCSLWNYIYEIHLSPSFFHSFHLSLFVTLPSSLPHF